MSGASGLADSTYQLDCLAETTVMTEALAEAIRDRMDGIIGADLGEGVNVRSCFIESDESDPPADPLDATQTSIYRRRIELKITHTESVPSL